MLDNYENNIAKVTDRVSAIFKLIAANKIAAECAVY